VPIDVLAAAPHYADHLAAVFGALPESERGAFVAPRTAVADHVRSLGFSPSDRPTPDNPMLVASWADLNTATAMGRTRVAIMEHGAGQSYAGRPRLMAATHGSYAGGQGRDAASLFLHPGPHPAERDRRAYPDAQVEVVGAPILDTLPDRVGDKGAVVAISFHFNASIAPESKSAFTWIWPTILGLRDRFDLIGHAHPRVFDAMQRYYKRAGIEPVRSFSDVCRRADVYVCDNSSTLFAFAATGRPVVVLNPPWYSRDVDHGLRFWEAADVGVNCDDRSALGECIDEALRDAVAQRERRERALGLVYGHRDGAAKRAADVLLGWAA
jgi:hypothetical protein